MKTGASQVEESELSKNNGGSAYWNRAVGRRRFVGTGIAVGGSAAFLAACGGSNNNNKGAATSAAPAASATKAAGTAAPGAAASATRAAGTSSPAAAAAGGAGAPQKGGVGRGTAAQVYDLVDPHRALGDPSLRLFTEAMSKLVWFTNPDTGELEPDVAEKYEIVDPSTYTFTLRKGVKWHNKPTTNGREFVADDVKWHIERQAQAKTKDGQPIADMQHQTFYKSITKIETPDQYTVKLTLDAPSGTFMGQLAAYFSSIPNRETTEKFENDPKTLTEDAVVGTGPYILTQFRPGKDVLLKRNPDYFRKDQPLLDGQVWTTLFADPNAQRAAFEQKQLDSWGAPDPSVTKSVLDANKSTMYEVLSGVANTVFLHLNMNQQFKDVRLVQAMNMAIDRRALIQTFHQGLGQVSGPVPWLAEGYAIPATDLNNVNGYRTDRAAENKDARALWTAGGGPALGDVDVKIPQTWLDRWPDTPQIIAKMFNDSLGVTQFKSTTTDYNTEIIPNLPNGKFPNWFAWTSIVNNPDPRETIRNTFLSASPANFNKVKNADLDKLIIDALQITDLKQAVAKVKDIQKILTDNAQYGNVVLYNYINRGAVWNYMPNGVATDGGGPLKQPAQAGKSAVGYNLYAGHLIGQSVWVNTKDPSYQGRPAATV